MTEEEQKRLDAVYDYCKEDAEFWQEQSDTIKYGFLAGLIMMPLLLVGCILLGKYAPDFWERITRIMQW